MAQHEWIEKDYYADLGVAQNASAEEIKKNYRKLARDNHPDKNPGNAEAEEKFKAVSEAYSVIGDKEKRKEYDELKRMIASGAYGAPGGFSSGFSGSQSDFSMGDFSEFFSTGSTGSFGDIFGDIFNRGSTSGMRRSPRRTRGADVETELTLDFLEATKGATVPIRLTKPAACATCRGSGAESDSAVSTCQSCGGTGFQKEQQGTFGLSRPCPDCQGTGTRVEKPCSDCAGTGRTTRTRTITVRVPAGVEDGQKIRLAGQGEAGERGRPAGDLFVTVHVRPDKLFTRKGDDLLLTIPVSYSELVLGGTVSAPTLDNKVRVRIPQGTEDGTTLRVRGRGVPRKNGSAGDLLVTVKVAVPKNLDDGAISALRRYAEEEKRSGFDPRAQWSGNIS